MGYPLTLARRYLGSKKRSMISISTALAVMGVTLGVAALAVVMSVTAGFQEQFRDKVLGVNAHVLVLKYSIDFREYRKIMRDLEAVKGVVAVAPFVINPMLLTHGERTATGVLLKGVDPTRMKQVLDLPRHIIRGDPELTQLRRPGAVPPEPMSGTTHTNDEPSTPRALDAPDDRARGAPTRTESPLAAMRSAADATSPEHALSAEALDAGVAAAPPSLPPDAPRGDITPDGGYKSDLPVVDVIPDSIEPDPCRVPEEVASLPGIVIGSTLATQLDANLGDCVQVTSPTIGLAYGDHPPIMKRFRVIAMFEAGFEQYDAKLVYSDLYEAQAWYEYGDTVTGVEMRVEDIDKSADVADEVKSALNNGLYNIVDWRQLNHGLFTALLIQQIAMSVVLALIIVVATFTVIATLIMVVLDKKKEIALLKAIGARDGDVLRVFLYQGGIIGLLGTTLGLAIGWGFCRFLLSYGFPLDPKVYFISKLPVSMHPSEFVITGTFAIVTCLMGTIFPALYAAKLRPSDGLRAE